MARYTAYKLNLDGWLDHKEYLDNIDEVNEWVWRVNHSNMVILGQTAFVYATFNGEDMEVFTHPLEELDSFLQRWAS